MTRYNDEQLRSMRSQGMTYPEIAQALGTKTKYIKNACIRRNIEYTEEERQKAVERGKENHIGLPVDKWEEKVEEKSQGKFEFVCIEGRKDGETLVRVRCKPCQFEKIVSAISLRHKDKQMKCPECEKKDREKDRERLKKAEKINQQAEHMNSRIRLSGSMKGQMGVKFCECGSLVPFGKQNKCDECLRISRRKRERRKETKRRMRCEGGDFSITTEDLYIRYDGICYLCGGKCDWDDYEIRNGTKVVGPTYPTQEHIIPISKGGKHEWENLNLAHHLCNSRKGARMVAPVGSYYFF